MTVSRLSLLLAALSTVASVRADDISVPPGFHVDKLYDVPEAQGSWVCLTFDPKGRIIASHERGGLYRVTLPASEKKTVSVEKLSAEPGAAHGLLWANDSLYVVAGGVWRLQYTTGDDQFDRVDKLFTIEGRGEHGPHAIVQHPANGWLYLIAGNSTAVPKDLTADRVIWESGSKPDPQGWVLRINRDGSERELVCVGLRNSYGLAMHPTGDLFTFDSDNEGFMGLPWYRPANLFHLVAGADYGWRQGPETRQAWHPDNLPPVQEIGPGSPTGMTFGTGASFPLKYQKALFLCDWSYGRIYAVHLTPVGTSWKSTQEVFATGRPLAATDIRVGPDGNLYFLTGGRGTASALFRISWEGDAVTSAAGPALNSEPRRLLQMLQTLHDQQLGDHEVIETAWPHLRNPDRIVRYTARNAIERTPVQFWIDRAMTEADPEAALEALVALSRQLPESKQETPDSRAVLNKLLALPFDLLTPPQRLAYLRVIDISIRRMGMPNEQHHRKLLDQFDPLFPSDDPDLNRELIHLLVTLRSEDLVNRTINVLESSPSAMNQIYYLRTLSRLDVTFSDSQKKRLHKVLDLEMIRDTGSRGYRDVAQLIGDLLEGVDAKEADLAPLPVIQQWTAADLEEVISKGSLTQGNIRSGQHAFRKAQCHRCHRIGANGGTLGPNLTTLSSRYKSYEVLESILEPSKVISDQYRMTVFIRKNGAQFTGQIVNLSGDNYQVRLKPSKPFPRVNVPMKDIDQMVLSKVSLMPKGLLDVLTKHEIRDLLAYLMQAR